MSPTDSTLDSIAPATMIVGRRAIALFEPGDRLDQRTFHLRCAASPNVRAELVQGVVVMAAAAMPQHGEMHSLVLRWIWAFQDEVPELQSFVDTVAILGPESEPRPDAYLMIPPDKGGQMQWSQEFEGYLQGAPELVAEVASSTESYDLHGKKADYEREGVLEYIVVALRQRRVFWFVNRGGVFEDLPPGEDGILRSTIFPGLWLDPAALIEKRVNRLLKVVRQGLATPEHVAFAKEMASRK